MVREVERGRFRHDSPCAYAHVWEGVHACLCGDGREIAWGQLTVCVHQACGHACTLRNVERERLHRHNSLCVYLRACVHACMVRDDKRG